jgi:hypothetical protein
MSRREAHPAALDPAELARDCVPTFTRRSGPGGQNRNKVETAVILRHGPTGLTAEAAERRSQLANYKEALFRLRLNLALGVRTPVEPATPPGDLWLARCRGGRISVSPEHDDFPAMLAEALDRLDACANDVKAAAAALGCTPSQLTRFLKGEPRALLRVNQARQEKGLRPLL